MFKSCTRLLAFAIATAAAVPAVASTITIQKQGSSVFGANGWAGLTINSAASPDVGPLGVKAGAFALKGNLDGAPGDELFNAFCLDIEHWLHVPSEYQVTNTPFAADALTGLQKSNIQKLFDTAYAVLDLTVAKQSAGFQLALWEIIYESAGSPFGLGGGNFKAWGNAAATTYADGLLAGLSGAATGHYTLTFLQSLDGPDRDWKQDSQNLVTAAAVPLPAAGLLLLAGLGGLGLMRRRRA